MSEIAARTATPIRWRSRRRATVAMATTVMAAVPLYTGCDLSGGDGPVEPPTSASVAVSMSWAAQGAPKCTWPAIGWTASPASLDASGTGATSAQSATTAAGEAPSSGASCTVMANFGPLHPGSWTFTTSTGHSVVAVIKVGVNSVSVNP